MNEEAANILASALEKDAEAHDSGDFINMGMRWDDIYGEILPIEDNINIPIYAIAFRFWDEWSDAANHNWKYHEAIRKSQWPILAKEIAQNLRLKSQINNQVIIDNFTPDTKVSLIKKIKKWLQLNI